MLIDLSEMNSIYYDSRYNAITVETGATLGQVYQALFKMFATTVPGGQCPTVGVGGHFLGGGYCARRRSPGCCATPGVRLERNSAPSASAIARSPSFSATGTSTPPDFPAPVPLVSIGATIDPRRSDAERQLTELTAAVTDGANAPQHLRCAMADLYYKDNYPRLQQIKAKWDPGNVFRYAMSIQAPTP